MVCLPPERRGRPVKSKEKIIEKYRSQPVLWLEDTFGVELTDYQEEIINSTFENRYTSVRSGHGLGKSYSIACAVVAFLHLHVDSLVLTTASTRSQLSAHWSPIRKLMEQANAPLGTEVFRFELRCGPLWRALGLSTNDPANIVGFHSEKMLVVVDESCGVDPEIHDRIDTLLTSEGSHRLDCSNPYSRESPFKALCDNPETNEIHLSCYDSPNVVHGEEVVPGLVSKEWIERKRQDWGENSDMWRVAVLGEWPLSDSDALIPVDWVQKAQDRWEEVEPDGEPIYGVDPGGAGTGETVIVTRRGSYVSKVQGWYGLEGPAIIQKVKENTMSDCVVNIDSVGLGSTLPAYAKEEGIYAVGINGAEVPIEREDARNRRAECYLNLRDALDPNGDIKLAIPSDDVLAGQLTSIKYKLDSKGRVQLESKKEMKSRGLNSPDRADALAYTFSGGQSAGLSPISVGVGEGSFIDDNLARNSPFEYVSWRDF